MLNVKQFMEAYADDYYVSMQKNCINAGYAKNSKIILYKI